MTNFRTDLETTRKKTYRFSDENGWVTFYIDKDVSTYSDGSILIEEKFVREDNRDYTNASRRYTEFKNINSFNSAMRRIVKEGLVENIK